MILPGVLAQFQGAGGGSGPLTGRPHRYWRVNVTEVGFASTVTIAKLELRGSAGGADQVTGGTVIAGADLASAPNAYDANDATWWESGPTPQWIGYTFASPKSVHEVLVRSRSTDLSAAQNQTPKAFNVESSDDGVTWITEWSVSGQTGWGLSESRVFSRPGVYEIYPSPAFSVSHDGLTITVTDTSTDADGTVSSVSVNWGDGNSEAGVVGGDVDHTYASVDVYTITLTATDDDGNSAAHELDVTVGAHYYWRVYVTGTDNGGWTAITELEIRATSGGADQTSGGTAIAGTTADGSPAGAFDNNNTTYWAAFYGTTCWVGYQFASRVACTEISIRSRDSFSTSAPATFAVQFSDDGTTWTTAWSVTGSTGWANNETRVFTKP